jgi:hypothetical protein
MKIIVLVISITLWYATFSFKTILCEKIDAKYLLINIFISISEHVPSSDLDLGTFKLHVQLSKLVLSSYSGLNTSNLRI